MKTMRRKGQRKLTERVLYSAILLLQFFAYGTSMGPVPASAQEPDPVVTLEPADVYARQKMDPLPLTFTFTVPSGTSIQSGGIPEGDFIYYGNDSNQEVIQIELPRRGLAAVYTDEEGQVKSWDKNEFGSQGLALFDVAVLDPTRDPLGRGVNWSVEVTDAGECTEVMIANPTTIAFSGKTDVRLLGVYAGTSDGSPCELPEGSRVKIEYTGHVPGRATRWGKAYDQYFEEHTFRPHFRYRSFDGDSPSDWIVLSDDQVGQLSIEPYPGNPAFASAIAPLDIVKDEPFAVNVILTDKYGNPRSYSGYVGLTLYQLGEYPVELDCIEFNEEWAKDITEHGLPAEPLSYASAGIKKIVPTLYSDDECTEEHRVEGVRSVSHWSVVSAADPGYTRLMGDLHIHAGNGGSKIKFMEDSSPGDHIGLYTDTQKALEYLQYVAGYDFGAISEHAISWEGYYRDYLLPKVAGDPAWEEEGECYTPDLMGEPPGLELPDPGFETWWHGSQEAAYTYQQEQQDDFTVFPAYEWHTLHTNTGIDESPLHRIVLFQDFDAEAWQTPEHDLPLLAGDIDDIPPQCLVYFLKEICGYGPDVQGREVLTIPHMMMASSYNLEMPLTYGGDYSHLADFETMDDYQRVGEIFGGRNFDQAGYSPLTVFEGDSVNPETYSYRHGWREMGAHIGLIGASDNHYQMPGVNDTRRAAQGLPEDEQGTKYQYSHTGGAAFVLAEDPATGSARSAIFSAFKERHTYATSGVRAWLGFYNMGGGEMMGSRIEENGDYIVLVFSLLAGMEISNFQLVGARVGDSDQEYKPLVYDSPTGPTAAGTFYAGGEIYIGYKVIPNPVRYLSDEPGTEWLYYVRAFLNAHGCDQGPDEMVWSSPIWVTWSAE